MISDMGSEFEGGLGELMEAHGIRQYFTASQAPWQNGLVERNGGIWKATARKTIKGVGAQGFVEMQRLASMVSWAKNALINSSGYSQALWVIGRGYKLPWSLLDEKQSGELASLELPGGAARRAFETMDTSHRARRALLAGVRASSHTQRNVTGELVFVLRKATKNRTDARTAFFTHRWYGPAIVFGKQKNNESVSNRGRVTKVALECLRKASVAELMSWDITTKDKALFETALDKENLSWEEPLLDESGEFHDSEKSDTMTRPQNLEEEVNSTMNDDDDLPFSSPFAEKDDHSEDETQVEEPDPVTEESRDVVREPLRLPPRLRSKQRPPSVEPEEGVESKSKRARVNVSELLHDAFLAKAARSNGMVWMGVRSYHSLRPFPSNGMHDRKTQQQR